jgi:LacI family transcriptional regulator
MYDIAVKAGVSKATVSYVLNGRKNGVRISDETRERILAVAGEMGYRRNELARAIVTGKNMVLGVLSHDPRAEAQSRIMYGIQQEAYRQGYFIKIIHVPEDMQPATTVARCVEQRIAGVICINLAPPIQEELSGEATKYDLPLSVVDDSNIQDCAIRVATDEEQSVELALNHLTDLGHRRIAHLAGPFTSVVATTRRLAFERQATSQGLQLPDGYIAEGHWWSTEVNLTVAQKLLTHPTKPTAILCAADWSALTVVRVARQMEIKIPQELSVMGFGGFFMTELADPPLTTILQPFEGMGRVATEHLLSRLEKNEENSTPIDIKLPSNLLVRDSTAPPKEDV